MKPRAAADIPIERVEHSILLIRCERVMLDSDLARFYGVTTKRLNEQVKRNRDRFPEDFMFQLTEEEKKEVVANCDHLSQLRFSASLPFAFTEHGAIMAASVLNTPRAVDMSIFVLRAFVRLRSFVTTHKELAIRLTELEKKLATHDDQIQAIIETIKQLLSPFGRKKASYRLSSGGGNMIFLAALFVYGRGLWRWAHPMRRNLRGNPLIEQNVMWFSTLKRQGCAFGEVTG